MTNKIGRPKADNPKNIDVKVRFDEKTHNDILKYCKENKITKTELLRKGVDGVLKLTKGIEYEDIKEYKIFLEKYLRNFNKEKFSSMGREAQKKDIKTLNKKLDELYGLIDKMRDKYLKELGLDYNKDFFEKHITLEMPININLILLQKEYFQLIDNLYECMGVQ